jgi:septation ring formation regulator
MELTETYIQYANRYRSRNQEIAIKLEEAESELRAFNYSEAYTVAKSVIETVNPELIEQYENQDIFEKIL